MKKRLAVVAVLVVALMLGAVTVEVFARDHGKKESKQWNLEEKFSHKVKFLMKKQEELGLSDEQMQTIKDLKVATKKDLIMKKAEIEILAVDIKAALYQDAVDIDAVNALIDKKYELKKQKAKALVNTCATLKSILTKDQKAKMKQIFKEMKKEDSSCPMKKGAKGHCSMMKGGLMHSQKDQ
ncbi:Spy/CpxP family protein refolding chaperone [Candidatus Omnitrophota bacterium]